MGQYEFGTVYRTDVYAEQRGLEQMLYDAYPDAEFNYIREISERNPTYGDYMADAERYLAVVLGG